MNPEGLAVQDGSSSLIIEHAPSGRCVAVGRFVAVVVLVSL